MAQQVAATKHLQQHGPKSYQVSTYVLIMASKNRAAVLCVKLKNQKQVEIVSLLKPEGLSRVQDFSAMPPEDV